MAEGGVPQLTKEDNQLIDYIESLLATLTTENLDKVVSKLKKLTFKTRQQLQHFSDLIFKYALHRPEIIPQYGIVCEELKEAKVTVLIFDKVEDKESLEIANLRFHILLKTRAELSYDQIGALRDNYDLFAREIPQSALKHVYAIVRSQLLLIGELYKHELVKADLIFAMINRLASMIGFSEFFLECLVSLLELTAKGLEAKNKSLGKYFKHIKRIAINNSASSELVARIKNLLKLKRTKWLGGEGEVPPELVENLVIDENLKKRALKEIEEELGKYISMDRCRSCCVEFEAPGRINHLISKQHTASVQTLLRDQYQGNLISGRVKACVMCQETNIEKIFIHFSAPTHKINTTTFCFICQTKFKSAFFLSKHLRTLCHRKELLKMYDSILKTNVLEEIIAKENYIMGEDSFDEADDTFNDDEEFNRLLNENAALRENIFKYLDVLTSDNSNIDEEEIHEKIIKELDKFVENICNTNNTSTKKTVVLLRQFNQEADDVKISVKCAKGDLPLIDKNAEGTAIHSSSLVNLIKDQYAVLCEDVKAKVNKLKKEIDKHQVEVKKTIKEPTDQDTNIRNNDQEDIGKSSSVIPIDQTSTSTNLPQSLLEDLHKEDNLQFIGDEETATIVLPHFLQEYPDKVDNLQFFVDEDHVSTTLPQSLPQDPHESNLQAFVSENKDKVYNKDTALTCAMNNLKELMIDNDEHSVDKGNKKENTHDDVSLSSQSTELTPNPINKKSPNTSEKVLTVFNIRGVNVHVTEVKEDFKDKNLATTSGDTNTNFNKANKQESRKNRKKSKGVISTQIFENSSETKSAIENKGKKQNNNEKNTSDKGAIPKIRDIKEPTNYSAGSSSPQREQPILNAPTVNQKSQVSAANASSKNKEVNGLRIFNLKRMKLKTFARLKRKLTEKLRSTENIDKRTDDEKILSDVISLIRKCYTSDDVSLEVSLRLFQNFNAKMNSETEPKSLQEILKELDRIFKI